MSLFYPPVDEATIRNLLIMAQLVQEHPNYFSESPYSQEMEKNLKKLLRKPDQANLPATPHAPKEDDASFDMMKELRETYKELNTHKPSSEEDAAMMSYYRTRTSLLEKILGLIEQAHNQKQVSDFFAIVISILEETMSPTQQTQFMERLESFK